MFLNVCVDSSRGRCPDGAVHARLPQPTICEPQDTESPMTYFGDSCIFLFKAGNTSPTGTGVLGTATGPHVVNVCRVPDGATETRTPRGEGLEEDEIATPACRQRWVDLLLDFFLTCLFFILFILFFIFLKILFIYLRETETERTRA